MTTVLLNETNEDQRNSNAKNNNNEQLFIHSIKRVVIMDVKTQLTIFEHKKKWGGADSTDGVDALVKTFYQLFFLKFQKYLNLEIFSLAGEILCSCEYSLP